MKKSNSFPVVAVHGFMCYGDQELINKVIPTFGFLHCDAAKAITAQGIECYEPSVGPYTASWDRACILYAKIKGGRVDYGKAHSEQFGHARYGAEFKGMIPSWGTLDENGKRRKINLIAHSFGGPTVMMLIHLLYEGDEQERNATPESELSDLFRGGKTDWVHAVTTLAATHNGVTLPEVGKPLLPAVEKMFLNTAATLGRTKFTKVFDFHLEQFGISDPDGSLIPKKTPEVKDGIRHYMSLNEDNIFYELGTKGYKQIKEKYGIKTYDNIYYMAYGGTRTKKFLFTDLQIPAKQMNNGLKLFGFVEGMCPFTPKEWRANDGLVNIPSVVPEGAQQAAFDKKENCRPGIWYTFPTEFKDHVSYMGIGEDPDEYAGFFTNIVDAMTDFPVL